MEFASVWSIADYHVDLEIRPYSLNVLIWLDCSAAIKVGLYVTGFSGPGAVVAHHTY